MSFFWTCYLSICITSFSPRFWKPLPFLSVLSAFWRHARFWARKHPFRNLHWILVSLFYLPTWLSVSFQRSYFGPNSANRTLSPALWSPFAAARLGIGDLRHSWPKKWPPGSKNSRSNSSYLNGWFISSWFLFYLLVCSPPFEAIIDAEQSSNFDFDCRKRDQPWKARTIKEFWARYRSMADFVMKFFICLWINGFSSKIATITRLWPLGFSTISAGICGLGFGTWLPFGVLAQPDEWDYWKNCKQSSRCADTCVNYYAFYCRPSLWNSMTCKTTKVLYILI